MGINKFNCIPFFYSIGILLNCLFFTTIVLDYTLVPRFVFLSFFILTFSVFILFFSKKEVKIGIDLFILPFFAYSLFSVISIIWSLNVSMAIIEASKTILYLFVFVITFKILRCHEKIFIEFFLKTILILFIVSSIKALVQFLELPNLSRINLYGVTSICSHKNLYSSFIFLCIIFTLISFFYLKSYWKIISSLALFGQIVLIVLLQTRAVWLGCCVFIISGFIAYLLFKRLRILNFKYLISFLITSIILINIFFISVLPRLLNVYIKYHPSTYNVEKITDLSTTSERVLIWDKTYKIFFSHKFLGVGANNWQIYFPSFSLPDVYRITDLNVTFQRPHNDFLWLLSEYGLIGFNFYIIFILTIVSFLFFKLKNSFDFVYVIIISGIFGFLSISFIDFPKERIEHNILFIILLCFAYFLIKKESRISNIELFYIPKFVVKASIIPLIGIFYFSLLDFKGEYFTKKMQLEKSKNNNKGVIIYSERAQSICFTTDPTTVPLYWFRGNANANLGNYTAAFEDFKKAICVHPFNHNVLNDLGSSYFLNNEIDSAKFFYMKAAAINPRFDDPKLNLTAIYINEGNYKEAQKWNESLFHDSERRNLYRGIINNHK